MPARHWFVDKELDKRRSGDRKEDKHDLHWEIRKTQFQARFKIE